MPLEKLPLTIDDVSKTKISHMTENKNDNTSGNEFESMRTFKRLTVFGLLFSMLVTLNLNVCSMIFL